MQNLYKNPCITVGIIALVAVLSYYSYKKYYGNSLAEVERRYPSFSKLILIRHGEKPSNGLGNLDCKGLNRSLALPRVLLSKFGKPDYIFAPNPARKIIDDGVAFNYIRPLVTIEPTAIYCNLPINSNYGYTDIGGLLKEVVKPEYRNKTLFVAWEHKNLDIFAKEFFKRFVTEGSRPVPGRKSVPDWSSGDFDSIFIFEKNYRNTITFHIDHEGLNGVSEKCPF